MAQGAVQSIEDAAVLAKCLERADAHEVNAALQRYEQTRKPRASRCQEGSRRNGIMNHLADGDEQRKRDAHLASSTTAPLPQNAWLYGHDVEAEFEHNMKPRKWKTLRSDVAYSTPIFDLHRRRSTHARRGERDFFILEAPNWVNIIPLAKNGDVVMIRQWRHGISEFTLEVPGGMVDPEDPSPMHAARREMVEETGFDSDAIVELGKVHPNPAIQGNICFSFLAENVRQVERVVSLGDEETEVVMVPMREIRGLIAAGDIMHALTIAAFSFLHLYNPPPKRKPKSRSGSLASFYSL